MMSIALKNNYQVPETDNFIDLNFSEKKVTSSSISVLKKIDLFEDLPVDFPAGTYFHLKLSVLFFKRALDILGAFFGLLILSPLMTFVALLIKLTSEGPVLFFQPRVGLNGNIFNICKFRSMVLDAEKTTGAVWAEEGKGKADPRTTFIGNFLRKTHLDELPQLFLVLTGKMSFVGPRPERPMFVSELNKYFSYYDERHIGLKPGITGIAQAFREIDPGFFVSETKSNPGINSGIQFSSKSLNETNEKLIFDHTYALLMQNQNFLMCCFMDIKIIFFTFFNIFKKLTQSADALSKEFPLSPTVFNTQN
jgi:lipopolysaccharide/colanic/teichoic acid biosynthesis glycosyltransferase